MVNDDMMQYVTCNKLSLFAPRFKILKKNQGKKKFIIEEQEKNSSVLEMRD
jgi:hypothetical protein